MIPANYNEAQAKEYYTNLIKERLLFDPQIILKWLINLKEDLQYTKDRIRGRSFETLRFNYVFQTLQDLKLVDLIETITTKNEIIKSVDNEALQQINDEINLIYNYWDEISSIQNQKTENPIPGFIRVRHDDMDTFIINGRG